MKLYANLSSSILQAEGIERPIPISCFVRNELNGLRKIDEVVYTMPAGIPYYPRRFPTGIWSVTGIRRREDIYREPFFIATDAHQLVDEWRVDDGPDGRPRYASPTGRMVQDREYGLHFSRSPTTTGCIKIEERSDLLDLVDRIREAFSSKDLVTLEVVE